LIVFQEQSPVLLKTQRMYSFNQSDQMWLGRFGLLLNK
jgi:hypothetical protein